MVDKKCLIKNKVAAREKEKQTGSIGDSSRWIQVRTRGSCCRSPGPARKKSIALVLAESRPLKDFRRRRK